MLMGMVTKDREEQGVERRIGMEGREEQGVGRRMGIEGREHRLQHQPVENSIGQGRSDRSCGE